MAKITYDDKVALNEEPSVAAINKVSDNDMNEIKSSVNDLYDTVSTNTQEIENIKSSIEETQWTNISFTSTYWNARSGYEPKFKKIGNVVYITGQVVPKQNLNALTNYGLTASNLPTPTYQHSFTTSTYGGVVATGWISGNSITIRPFSAIPSTEVVGCAIDGCYITN